jgi:hypothetical protein
VNGNGQIKGNVETFYRHLAPEGMLEDAFTPWWLTRKFGISAQKAIGRAPGGSHDYALDGFHVELDADPRVASHPG